MPNKGAIETLADEDVVEINCHVDDAGIHYPAPVNLPRSVAGLIETTKAYERALVTAAIEQDRNKMVWALTQNSLVGDWDEASRLVASLLPQDKPLSANLADGGLRSLRD